MPDPHRRWIEHQIDAARERVSDAPSLHVGAVDDTHTYPIRLHTTGDAEAGRLLTRIPDTWAERRDEKRVRRALVDALKHHLEG